MAVKKEIIYKRVEAGAELLDERVPGWRRNLKAKIDSQGLDLADCSRCVLGHLFGEFDNGSELDLSHREDTFFGFDMPSNIKDEDFYFDTLRDAWLEELKLPLTTPKNPYITRIFGGTADKTADYRGW